MIKHKKILHRNEIINKIKRQHKEWKKIVASDAANKELISKISKQLIKLNTVKTTQSKDGQKS